MAVFSRVQGQGLPVRVGERRAAGAARDVHLRGALRVQPLHVRACHAAVRPGEQEGQLLLRARLQLPLLQRHGLTDPCAARSCEALVW